MIYALNAKLAIHNSVKLHLINKVILLILCYQALKYASFKHIKQTSSNVPKN